MRKQVEDYKYSSLPGLLGQQHLGFPCYAPEDLFTDTIGHLKWLNEAPTEVQSEAIKKAMQKNIFKISKDKSGREVELEVRRTFSTSIFEEKVRRTF